MLDVIEYLGFAIRRPEQDGAIVYVFEILEEGVKQYGGYKMMGETERHTNLTDAAIISMSFMDGTMPISVAEFDERVKNGETSESNEFNMFIRINLLDKAVFSDGKTELYKIMDEDPNGFLTTMFYKCVEAVERLDAQNDAEIEALKPKPKRTRKKVNKSKDPNV